MTKFQLKYQKLEKASAELVAKLKAIHAHPDYKAMWSLAQAHGMDYEGPNYQAEFETLNNLLGNNEQKPNVNGSRKPPVARKSIRRR
jgi:hypothetical protein